MGVTRKQGEVPENMIVHSIQLRAPQRQSQNIEKWRSAIRNFENEVNPSRLKLYDLYEDICLDGQIESVWGKRLDWVQAREIVFVGKDKKEDEVIGQLINSPDMRGIIKEILNSLAWGYTLIQVNAIHFDEVEESWKINWDLIPRKHVHPERKFRCISRDQSIATRDFLYMEEPLRRYMLWAGEEKDMGLLVKAAQYVIYKRGDFGDWAQFAEMFGSPFREISYDDYDDATRIKLEQAMKEWGSANYLMKPKGAELKLHDMGGQAGSNTLYKDLKDACNAEISKIFLGNTLTTEQGDKGARSLGQVHQEGEAQKHDNDKKYVLDILNTRFRAILKVFGLNVSGGYFMYKEDEADWDKLLKKWQVYSGIGSKVPIDDDTIYYEFGLTRPENYDELKEEMRNNAAAGIMAMLGSKEKDNDEAQNNPLNNDKKGVKNFLIEGIRNFFV